MKQIVFITDENIEGLQRKVNKYLTRDIEIVNVQFIGLVNTGIYGGSPESAVMITYIDK